ncbi:hypothetical protein RJ639_014059 [Escallonia herrerae]|uniref:t-SNARE coiled-coil homology domain-containing protein n=1 Tax=Escallonia herrerae TaxID=1293975 RepID=A0AA88VKL9_9ASTE|nr:hypothetical protein RJ639_014059 [Escallonia herrerae]
MQEKSEMVAMETNRATVVAKNAEIRRMKARLMDEVPKLQKLAMKKVKGISSEEPAVRNDMVLALPERIQAIPDGTTTAANQIGGWAASASHKNINFDSGNYYWGCCFLCVWLSNEPFLPILISFFVVLLQMGTSAVGFFNKLKNQVNLGKNMRCGKGNRQATLFVRYLDACCLYHIVSCLISYAQDQGLDIISEGLDTLKDLAHDMNEELDRQVPLVDEIDTKVDGATADLKSTNIRLKETVTKMRSSRNFCIDIILLCIILGIATYLYKIAFVGDLCLSDSSDDDIIIVTI